MTSVSPSVFADSGDEFPLYGPFIIESMDGKKYGKKKQHPAQAAAQPHSHGRCHDPARFLQVPGMMVIHMASPLQFSE